MSHHEHGHPPAWKEWLFTTDHKKIGILYLITAFVFFLLGGLAALAIRWQLMWPTDPADAATALINPELFNQLFSMHGTTMIFLWIIPVAAGFGNYFVPLLIKARDMSFPRLNALSYWTYLAAGIVIYWGLFYPSAGAFALGNGGWTGYPPLSERPFSPGPGIDYWALGIQLVGVSSMMGAINFIVTTFRERGPGVTLNNMSLFVWSVLVTAVLVTFATPSIGSALVMLLFDRNLGTNFFWNPGCEPGIASYACLADPILYQHLFWFYSHPAVYVMILPPMGIVSWIIPRFTGRPIFGYKAMAYSMAAIGLIGFTVWMHHMFATGTSLLLRTGFMIMTMIIAVPSGVKVFNWLASIWHAKIQFTTPMLWSLGFVAMFTIGGVDGVFLASIPVDYHLHMTYWVVAHIHYVLFGGAVMGVFAGFYFWLPRMTGRMYNEKLGQWHFWLTLISLNIVFFTMHWVGYEGMPRRVYSYDAPFTLGNQLASLGAFILGAAQLLFIWNLVWMARHGPIVTKDPWGEKPTNEWLTYVPPKKAPAPGVAASGVLEVVPGGGQVK